MILSFAAHADEWSNTYTIASRPDLRVQTSDANIRVDTRDQNTIEAHVTTEHYKIGEHGIQIIEQQNGDSVNWRCIIRTIFTSSNSAGAAIRLRSRFICRAKAA